MDFGIYLSDALELTKKEGASFDITYRTSGSKSLGNFGRKENVKKATAKTFNEVKPKVKVVNRSATKLKLIDANGQRFEIFIALWISINNKLIDHRY